MIPGTGFSPDTIYIYDSNMKVYIKLNGITSCDMSVNFNNEIGLNASFSCPIIMKELEQRKELTEDEFESILLKDGDSND